MAEDRQQSQSDPSPELPMPGDVAASAGTTDAPLPPPPGLGRQMAQLVIIPAIIVIICIALATLFGLMAGRQTTIDNYLTKLRQSSGAGRMAFDLQDPRYKDRGLAAYNIATLIPEIRKQGDMEMLRVSQALVQILQDNVGENEEALQAYLLLALGELSQPGALEQITKGLTSRHPTVRQAAVRGLLSWNDPQAAAAALPEVLKLLKDESVETAATAAAAAGQLGRATRQQGGDLAPVLAALHEALGNPIMARREVAWNAAIALARLGDPLGERFVAEVLLDRTALSQLAARDSGPGVEQKLAPAMQDRLILSTLSAAGDMTSGDIWAKIKDLSQRDASTAVQSAARQLLLARDAQTGKPSPPGADSP